MEEYDLLLHRAKKRLVTADYILTMTYPVVKEAKLLLAVMESIFLSLTNAMGAILQHEVKYKKLPNFENNFNSKYALLKEFEDQYELPYLDTALTIKEIILKHKQSPVEFQKNNNLVICSDSYQVTKITAEKTKKYLSNAKSFIKRATTLVKDEPISR